MIRSISKIGLGVLLSSVMMSAPAVYANCIKAEHLAELNSHTGEICAGAHFVHNQTGGVTSGTLTVTFADGVTVFTFPSTKFNNGTVHYTIDLPIVGEIASVCDSFTTRGNLNLSGIGVCEVVKKDDEKK